MHEDLERGFDRIGAKFDPAESWADAVTRLAHVAAAVDPNVGSFGREVADLAVVLLAADRPNSPLN